MTEKFEEPCLDGKVEALKRLIAVAHTDTGQGRRVADFLLAWWNADSFGGFDFTHTWNVDASIWHDMLAVTILLGNLRSYPDDFVPREEIVRIIERWRFRESDE